MKRIRLRKAVAFILTLTIFLLPFQNTVTAHGENREGVSQGEDSGSGNDADSGGSGTGSGGDGSDAGSGGNASDAGSGGSEEPGSQEGESSGSQEGGTSQPEPDDPDGTGEGSSQGEGGGSSEGDPSAPGESGNGTDPKPEDGEEEEYPDGNYALTFTAEDIRVLVGDSSFDLMDGVSITDETGEELEVTADEGDFDIGTLGQYTITYSATHPVTSKESEFERTVEVMPFLYDPQPGSAEEVQEIVDAWIEAVLEMYNEISDDDVVVRDFTPGPADATGKEDDDEAAEPEAVEPEAAEPEAKESEEPGAAKPEVADTHASGGITASTVSRSYGDGEQEDGPDEENYTYDIANGGISGVSQEDMDALEDSFPELPKWEEAIPADWVPTGWVQQELAYEGTEYIYFTLSVGIMKTDIELASIGGTWSSTTSGSSGSHDYSIDGKTDITIKGYTGNTSYGSSYPRYYTGLSIILPTANRDYSLKVIFDKGWYKDSNVNSTVAKNMFPLPDKILKSFAYGEETADTWSVVYTIDQTATGSIGFSINELTLAYEQMYPGREMPITFELYGNGLDNTPNTLLSTHTIKATIQDYTDKRAQFGTYSSSNPGYNTLNMNDDIHSETDVATESGTASMTYYIYKQGDLEGTSWGATNYSYNDATITYSGKVTVDLSKLKVGNGSNYNNATTDITPDQLKAMDVTGTYVTNYDKDTGLVTIDTGGVAIRNFSISIKLTDWNKFPRSTPLYGTVQSTAGQSTSYGYTWVVFPDSSVPGAIVPEKTKLYLNGFEIPGAEVDFSATTGHPGTTNYVLKYGQHYKLKPVLSYTNNVGVQPPSWSSTTASSNRGTLMDGAANTPLFRVSANNNTNNPLATNVSFDVSVPAGMTVTHVILPNTNNTYFTGPITIDGQAIATGSTVSIVPLDSSVVGPGSLNVTINTIPSGRGLGGGGASYTDYRAGLNFVGHIDDGQAGQELDVSTSNYSVSFDGGTTYLTSAGGTADVTLGSMKIDVLDKNSYPQMSSVNTGYYDSNLNSMTVNVSNPLKIGSTYYYRSYLNTHSSNYYGGGYGSTRDFKEPVMYISLPSWMTTVRGDHDFKEEDFVFGNAANVKSFRVVDTLPGTSDGVLIEVTFHDIGPTKDFPDVAQPTYANNGATSGTSTIYPNTSTVYVRFLVAPDAGIFDSQNNSVTLANTTVLGGTTASDRVGTSSVSYTTGASPTLLSGSMNLSVDALKAHGINVSGLMSQGGGGTVYVSWPQEANTTVLVRTDKSNDFITYIPGNGPDATPDSEIPEMKAGGSGTMMIQVKNNTSGNGTDPVEAVFRMPEERGSKKWMAVAKTPLATHSSNTVNLSTVTVSYSTDGGVTYSTTFPSGLVTHIKINITGIPAGKMYAATFDFTVPFVMDPREEADYQDIAVGKTVYDLGQINGQPNQSQDGPTAALKLVESDAPWIIAPDDIELEYKLDTPPTLESLKNIASDKIGDDISTVSVDTIDIMFADLLDSTVLPASTITTQRKGVYTLTYTTTPDHDRQVGTDSMTITVQDTRPDPLIFEDIGVITKNSSPPSPHGTWESYFTSNLFVKSDEKQDPTDYSKMELDPGKPFNFDITTTGIYEIFVRYEDPATHLSYNSKKVTVGYAGAIGARPEIEADDVQLVVGSANAKSFYWTKHVKVWDAEDDAAGKPLTPYVSSLTDIYGNTGTYTPSNQPAFDPDKENLYWVTYTVVDSDNNTATDTATVLVAPHNGTEFLPWMVAPNGLTVPPGVTLNYDFTVYNPFGSGITLDNLTATPSTGGYTASVPSGTSVTVGAYGSSKVTARLVVPANASNGHIDTLTLAGKYKTTNNISASVATKIDKDAPFQQVSIVKQDNNQLVARVDYSVASPANTTVRILNLNESPVSGQSINAPNYVKGNETTFIFNVSSMTFNQDYLLRSTVAGVPYDSTIQFTLVQYHKVEFNANGGSAVATLPAVAHNTRLSETAAKTTRTGYTHLGWYRTPAMADADKWNFTSNTVTSSVNLYAKWKANEYTVSFNANGGNTPNPTSKIITYDQKYGALATATRTGYTLDGWYTAPNGGTKVNPDDTVKVLSGITLYAHWTANKYTASFKANDSDGGPTKATAPSPGSKIVTFDQNYGDLASISRNGYTFQGWWDAQSGGNLVQSATKMTTPKNHDLFARWSANKYTVTFDVNTGNALPAGQDKMAVTFGNTYGAMPTPTKKGYFFSGWYTAQTGGTHISGTTQVSTVGDHTLYAHWTAGIVDVNYDANGGTHADGTTVKAGKVTYDYPYGTMPAVSRPGYTLKGWYTAPTGGTEITAETIVTETVTHTLYAQWNVTMTFNTNGGNAIDPQTVDEGKTVTRPADPVKEGFIFSGWFTDSDTFTTPWNFADGVTIDTTIHAKWMVGVTFDAKGGTSVPGISPLEIGSTIPQPADPSKPNLTFDGWYRDDDVYADPFEFDSDPINVNTTLYAKWIAVVTFDTQGGTPIDPIIDAVEGRPIARPEDSILPRYALTGWFREADCINEWDFDSDVITGNLTLYAEWTYICTVQFVTNYNFNIDPTTVLAGRKIDQPWVPDRPGYYLKAWYTDAKYMNNWNYARDVVYDDMTLYIKWEKESSGGSDTPDGDSNGGGAGGSGGAGGAGGGVGGSAGGSGGPGAGEGEGLEPGNPGDGNTEGGLFASGISYNPGTGDSAKPLAAGALLVASLAAAMFVGKKKKSKS